MKKLTVLSAVTLAITLALTGCTAGQNAPEVSPSTPRVDVEEEQRKSNAHAVEEASAGDVEIVFQAQGEPNENGDQERSPVTLAVSVEEIVQLSEDELQELQTAASAEQNSAMDAYDFYKVSMNENYVSGFDPKGQSTSEHYRAVTKEGTALQSISAIGFEWCAFSKFSEAFASGEVSSGCIITAVPKDGPAPVGVRFEQANTKYDPRNGTPVVILYKAPQ